MKLFIIPGYTEYPKDPQYKALVALINKTSYTPILVPIEWKYKVMSDYVNQATAFIKQNSNNNEAIAILGFSFGAFTAFLSAKAFNTSTLFLCSLSPYFNEDLPGIRQSWKTFLGKRRIDHFKTISFSEHARDNHTNTIVLVGSKEITKYPSMLRRADDAHKKLKHSKLVIIEGAHHNIGQPEYQQAILKEL